VSIQVCKCVLVVYFCFSANNFNLHLRGMIFLSFKCFKCIKTASQQGVSLFIDHKDMFTCPLHVLAVALDLHPKPGRRIFPQFPQQQPTALPSTDEGNLVRMLEGIDNGEQVDPSPQQQRPVRAPPGAQAYVNRLLTSVTKLPATCTDGLMSGLSSHSFRRDRPCTTTPTTGSAHAWSWTVVDGARRPSTRLSATCSIQHKRIGRLHDSSVGGTRRSAPRYRISAASMTSFASVQLSSKRR